MEATLALVGLFCTRVLLLHETTGGAATSGTEEMTAGAEVTAAADEWWVMAGQLVTAVPHEVIVTMRVL